MKMFALKGAKITRVSRARYTFQALVLFPDTRVYSWRQRQCNSVRRYLRTRVPASNARREGVVAHWRDIIGKEWPRRAQRVSRFIPGPIFMHAATGHAWRSAVGDMFVRHDLLPTSATVNLVVTAGYLCAGRGETHESDRPVVVAHHRGCCFHGRVRAASHGTDGSRAR